MNRDPFADMLGAWVFLAFCFFFVLWSSYFVRRNSKPGQRFVWLFVILAGLGVAGILLQMMAK